MATEQVVEPVAGEREEYAGVLRFYELAKRQEWQVRDLPWNDIPPIPEGQGVAAAPGATERHVALRPHAAAPGGHARLRDGLTAPERRARSGGEALLLDDGAGRVAPHRGVAEADQRRGRDRRARPVPRRARAHDARGGHARGEGLPDAGLLRAADHLALPADRSRLARDRARGSLQPARDRRRDPPRRGDGLRAGVARRAPGRR